MSKSRFEAFSDGVFAFAITLLVLNFVLPAMREPVSNAHLLHALLQMWPKLVAYALSFGVIGIMWQNHQALFASVARVDRTTVFLNLLLLGGTAFIPFATDTLGSHPTLTAATFLYGIALTCCSTAYNLLLAHLIREHAFDDTITPQILKRTVRAYRIGWVGYTTAMLVALVAPLASFAAYLLIAGFYLIPHGVDAD